jgi:hypothetical protein
MAKRQSFHSVYDRKNDEWKVTKGGARGDASSKHGTQVKAEAAAVKLAKAAQKAGGTGQAIFHKKDHQIKKEYTYGKDPERTRG